MLVDNDICNEEITIMIGISYKGKPIAGVINQPYFEEIDGYEFRDAVIWSIDGLGMF